MNNAILYSPANWLDQFFTDFDKAWTGHKKSFIPNCSRLFKFLQAMRQLMLSAAVMPRHSLETLTVMVYAICWSASTTRAAFASIATPDQIRIRSSMASSGYRPQGLKVDLPRCLVTDALDSLDS